MEALRTPDARFEKLAGYDYAPRYIDDLPGYDGLRLHYIDEGPLDAEHTCLCLHGEPTWAYLYRKMTPVFTSGGCRVIAPDFFGFGRSDKPTAAESYSFSFHRNTLLRFIERLDLKNVTLVCQDWGGLLGLTLPLDVGDRLARLIVMNTAIAVGASPGKGFEAWRDYVRNTPNLSVGSLMGRAAPSLSEAERAAYDAPFPSDDFKEGVRRFPELVPTSPDMEGADLGREAATWWSETWNGPTFMAVGMQDPVLGPPVMAALRQVIRGCPQPLEIADAGHFVQEAGDVIAARALAAFAR